MNNYHSVMLVLLTVGAVLVSACNGVMYDENTLRDNLVVTPVNFADRTTTMQQMNANSNERSIVPVVGSHALVCHVVPADDSPVALLGLPVPGASSIGELITQAVVIHDIVGGYYVELPVAQGSTRGWVFMHSVEAVNCAPAEEGT